MNALLPLLWLGDGHLWGKARTRMREVRISGSPGLRLGTWMGQLQDVVALRHKAAGISKVWIPSMGTKGEGKQSGYRLTPSGGLP